MEEQLKSKICEFSDSYTNIFHPTNLPRKIELRRAALICTYGSLKL